MIDFIDDRCKKWGSQVRWVNSGKDGWPSRTTLGRMIEEGALGASSGRFVQAFPEVLNPDALEINNAVKKLRDVHREILFIQYVVIGRAKIKAQRMGIHRQTYYDRLNIAQCELARALYTPGIQDRQNCMSELAYG